MTLMQMVLCWFIDVGIGLLILCVLFFIADHYPRNKIRKRNNEALKRSLVKGDER